MIKSIKNFMFRMSATQIIAGIILLASVLIFVLFSAISSASGIGSHPIFGFLLLCFLLLLTRLSILVKVGIGFVNIILLPVTMYYGLLPAFAMILLTSYIYIKIATRPTPIDFLITKGVQGAIAQSIYFSIWVLTIHLMFKFVSFEYFFIHLTFMYMLCIAIYIIYMVPALHIIALDPLPITLVNGMMMMAVQFILITLTGSSFFMFVKSLAGV
ncbi:MAG: hypothetical protein ABIG20_00880 [archaeon]